MTLPLLLGVLQAVAAPGDPPKVRIFAEVSDDLQTITGRMITNPGAPLVDPLRALPLPVDDLTQLRTFPGPVEVGHVHWQEVSPGEYHFWTVLPRRFGDVGVTRHGLFANGAWYPQRVDDGSLPLCDWKVVVVLPDDAVGVLGPSAGRGLLLWSGVGERVSLAVLPEGQITAIEEDGFSLDLITRHRPRRALVREIRTQLDLARLVDSQWTGAVVEAPLRRRLVRPGFGLTYVSDRAYRVTPGARGVHRVAVTRGLLEGVQPHPDPFVRDLTAAGLSRRHQDRLSGMSAESLVKLGGWMPSLDALLNDGRMPFVTEIFETTHPGDPLQDDLAEIWAPTTPGPVVAAQLDDRFEPGTAALIGSSLDRGATLSEAGELAGVHPSFFEQWRVPYPTQDYSLHVDKQRQTVTVARRARDDAPEEQVVVSIDGDRLTWSAGPGPDHTTFELAEPPKRVRLDPDGHLGQTSRLVDAWPSPYKLIMAAWIDSLNLRRLFLEGAGAMWLRRRGDTRNLFFGRLSTNRENRLGLDVSYTRKFGPLVDGLSRRHRVTWGLDGAWLNPNFADYDEGNIALGGSMAWSWDSRVDDIFPLRGRSLSVGLSGGFVPNTDDTWVAARASAEAVVGLHPRHALAGRLSAGIADSTVPHRLLGLGGPGLMRSIPPGFALSSHRAVGLVEYRVAPLRNVSVPMFLVWGSELQLTGGLEGTVAQVDGEWVQAAGATAGIAGVGDVLGAEPTLMGVTAAWPVWVNGIDEVEVGPVPEIYIRWWQEF